MTASSLSLSPFSFWVGTLALLALLALVLFSRKTLQGVMKPIFMIACAAVLMQGIFYSYLQYKVWSTSNLGRFFLPPYQPRGLFGGYDYFLGYVTFRYLSAPLLALVVGGAFFFASRWLNRKGGERFFEDEEPWLFASGILLSGYPGFFFYVPLILLGAIVLAIIFTVKHWGRAPLYHLWIPCAILAILIVHFLVPISWLALFNL